MNRIVILYAFFFAMLSLFIEARVATAETLIFKDSIDSASASYWNAGTNTALHTDPSFTIEEDRLIWNQTWDYIETVNTFSGNFRVEVDVERPGASIQCKDFTVELVSVPAYTGVLRFQYGTIRKDSIGLGLAPDFTSISRGFEGACLHTPDSTYFTEMDSVLPHTGTVSLTHLNGSITFSLKNSQGQVIKTPAANAGNIESSKIRISSPASQLHYVNEVRIYSLDDDEGECAKVDLNNLDIQMNCLVVDGIKYRVKFLFDPAIQGGLYWKLDMNSIQQVSD